jgi:hypothetical protein
MKYEPQIDPDKLEFDGTRMHKNNDKYSCKHIMLDINIVQNIRVYSAQ